jgi:hypothetical protein
MAFEEILTSISMEASGDLSAAQYRFLAQDDNKTVAVAGAGDLALGVNQGNVDGAGKAVQVGVIGISKVEAGAAIDVAVNPFVASDANGKAVTAGAGAEIVGRAILSAAGDGELIPVLLGYFGTGA